MTPNRSHLSYPTLAPVFENAESQAYIIGYAKTAVEAVALYTAHYAGTGSAPVTKALKECPERKGEGRVDGWVPEFQDE